MGFQINKEFVKTTHGMAMVGQVGFACIGGILGIFWGTGFLEFMFWSSFFVSLSLLLSHLVNATQSLETAFPWLIKVELGYALIWGCLTTLAAVLAFLFFGLYILPAGFACIGGILGIFWGTGFLEFMFWSSFFVSLSLLLSHLVNATQSLETAFPWLIKVELGYALIWGCLTTLAALIGFALALCFFVDLFFKYRNYTRVIEPTPTTGGPA
ncbi:hypothetical protein TCAL_11955 [Tigriopus californicus]|uniref:Uncharacterized protein n=1 Tax=Tigriopus californicus TaxID=6832 RepID=A0A553PPM6_TIGCA|nr:hypothetical protein TCAL_11955 [Tigriopus californicus]